ncbi:MAG: OsmC family protein [Thermaerobacter sp.]|nr:OsmC family protein [Thermaerobacter sp.]
MADLTYDAHIAWSGLAREGEGIVALGVAEVPYSAPADMGGKGEGTSPEQLLLAAVGSCYSATLYRSLQRAGLPVSRVATRVVGTVADFPRMAHVSRVVVHPVVVGADATRLEDYRDQALASRDQCLIGKAIRGSVDYEVGEVQVEVGISASL